MKNMKKNHNKTISYKIKDKIYYIPNDIKINGNMKLTKKKILDEMYDLLKEIDIIFVKNEINYFITLGSLLGYRRHGGFIPWDDDIDICVFDNDILKINKLMNELKKDTKYKYQLNKCCPGYVFTKKKLNKKSFVDISILSKKDNFFMCGYPYNNNNPTFYTTEILFPKEIYFQGFVKNIIRGNFLDFKVNIPDNTDKILTQLYNEKCFTIGKYDAKKNLGHKSIKLIRNKMIIFEKILGDKLFYKHGKKFF